MENNQVQKRGYNHAEAVTVIGSDTVLREMVAAGWIKPVIKRHKLTLYSIESLDAAFERLIRGEYPGREASM